MKLYYIWDAYCGWCYGFESILSPFMARHPELDLEIISGGLFDAQQPISAYPHIPRANQEISRIYGVTFGPAYQTLLQQGSFISSSYHAATGFSYLRDLAPASQHLALAAAMQKAFYQEGHSLSDPATYLNIAQDHDLPIQELENQLSAAFQQTQAPHPDYLKARELNITTYPSLLLEKAGQLYDLRAGALTSTQLEDNFQQIQGLFEK